MTMKYWVPAIGGSLIIGAMMLLSGCDKIIGVMIEGGNKVDEVADNVDKIANRDLDNAIASCVSAVRSAYPDRDPYLSGYGSYASRTNLRNEARVVGYMKYQIYLAAKEVPFKPKVRNPGGGFFDNLSSGDTTYYQSVICNTENGVVTALRLDDPR